MAQDSIGGTGRHRTAQDGTGWWHRMAQDSTGQHRMAQDGGTGRHRTAQDSDARHAEEIM